MKSNRYDIPTLCKALDPKNKYRTIFENFISFYKITEKDYANQFLIILSSSNCPFIRLAFGKLKCISDLDLEYKMLQSIANNKKITNLSYSFHTARDHIQELIGKILSSKPALCSLDLSNSDLSSITLCALIDDIPSHSTLQVLDLSRVRMNESTLVRLLSSIALNKSIKELNMLGIFHDQVTGELSEVLGNMISKNNCLTALCLSKMEQNGIPFNLSSFFQALSSNNRSLTCLDISNMLTPESYTQVAEAIRTNPSLTHISFEACEIDRATMKLLCNTLTRNNSLTNVNFRYNASCVELGELIKLNSTLTTLFVEGTQTDDEEIIAIANGLESNTTLKHPQ